MFRKICRYIALSWGAFLALIFKMLGTSAMEADYGVAIPKYGVFDASEQTLGEKVMAIIFSPIFLIIFFMIAAAVGVVIFVKRKRKNVPEDN